MQMGPYPPRNAAAWQIRRPVNQPKHAIFRNWKSTMRTNERESTCLKTRSCSKEASCFDEFVQEIRRIAQRLARKRIQPADVIVWSL